MNAETLQKNLRRNLLRLWMHQAHQRSDPAIGDGTKLQRSLERILDQPLRVRKGLRFSDWSPESRLIGGLFPAGLPALQHYLQLDIGPLAGDHLAVAASLLVGNSPLIRDAIETALRLAPTSVPVLITGETGTGKDLFAQLIHRTSRIAHAPLVTVNCAAVPETLLLAELFGYEPGSFTGAAPRGRQGKVEAADGGTLFLDEVAELPPAGQAALLRFLDSGEVQKIGRVHPRKVRTRLICATQQRLEDRVQTGAFRQDLYYRIALVDVHVPALRDRLDDLPLLAAHFLREFQNRHQRPLPNSVSDEALRGLSAHGWPGNVRELMFTLERAFLLCRQPTLTAADLHSLISLSGDEPSDDRVRRLSERLQEVRPSLFRDRARWAAYLLRHADRDLSTGEIAREFELSEASVRIRLAALVQLSVLQARGARKGRRYRLDPSFLS